jgi:hypothetical protein
MVSVSHAQSLVHRSRYTLHPQDPDAVAAPVLCPHPECEGGTVPLAGPIASYRLPDWMPVGEMLCNVCDGEANAWPDDVADWADARGIELVVDEDWIYGT